MYVRFTARSADRNVVTRLHVAPGFFGAAYDLWYNRHIDDTVLLAIRQELDWFNDWLPAPRRLTVKARGRLWHDGVCWFRDDARDMLVHANALAALIADCGVPVDRCWTRDPGQILYRDRWQVVAKPERGRLH